MLFVKEIVPLDRYDAGDFSFSYSSLFIGYMWLWWCMFGKQWRLQLHVSVFVTCINDQCCLSRKSCLSIDMMLEIFLFLIVPCSSVTCGFGGACSGNSGGYNCTCPYSSPASMTN